MREKKGKDVSVELLRIIGCLIVIGVHTCLSAYVDGVYDESRLYIACIFADGVAVFWLITGFFLFKNTSYVHLLKRTLRNIILPAVILSVFMFFFGEFFISGVPIAESIYHSKEEYRNLFKTLLEWNNPVSGCGYLWYIYVYTIVMLTFPVLKSFINYLEEDRRRIQCFLVISLVVFILNDLSNNKMMAFSHHSINGAIPASIEIIWGGVLYHHKDVLFKKNGKVILLFGTFAFFLLNLLRAWIELYRGSLGEANNILYWYSSIGLICAVLLAIIAFELTRLFNKNLFWKHAILILGSYTFLIYLLHVPVYDFLNRFGLNAMLFNILQSFGDGVVFELLFTTVKVAVVFSGTLLIVIGIHGLINLISSQKMLSFRPME